MKRLLALAALAASLFSCQQAAFATDPVSIETKWNSKMMSISTTGVTSITIDPGGFGARGYAIIGSSYTQNGVDGTTLGVVTLVSSNTPNVFGFSFTALPQGGTANLQWAQTLKTPAPRGIIQYSTATSSFNSSYPAANAFTVPQISTSSVIAIPSGVAFSDTFSSQVSNPVFYVTGLTASGTFYMTVEYGVVRAQ